MDPWELFDPVDVLPRLPSTFKANLESKKWLERKEALESLLQLLMDHPRLCSNAQYHDIVRSLNTILDRDSNINVCSVAAKCLTALAKGLRKDFFVHSRTIIPTILSKFKEKKLVLKEPLVECVDAVYLTTNLEAIMDPLLEASQKPNPDIKAQLSQFLYRCLKHLKATDVPKRFLKEFVPVLMKFTGESDPEVRNSACAALGSFMKCVGQKSALALFGSDFAADKAKIGKIEEFCKKATIEAEEEAAAFATIPDSHQSDSVNASAISTEVSTATEEQIDPWELIDPVDILRKLPSTLMADLESKKWMERKEALESLLKLLTDHPRLCPNTQYGDIFRPLNAILEKDSNINVASVAAKCLTGLAKGLRTDFGQFARHLFPVIFAKFKEKKMVLREPLVECADAVYATTHLEAISDSILEASQKPNPDIKTQLDLFLYRALTHTRIHDVPKKFVKEFTSILTKHAGDSDPEVRNAAFAALGAVMRCVGRDVAAIMFGDLVSDKTKMTKIEESFNRSLAEAPPETSLPHRIAQLPKTESKEVASKRVNPVNPSSRSIRKTSTPASAQKPKCPPSSAIANRSSLAPRSTPPTPLRHSVVNSSSTKRPTNVVSNTLRTQVPPALRNSSSSVTARPVSAFRSNVSGRASADRLHLAKVYTTPKPSSRPLPTQLQLNRSASSNIILQTNLVNGNSAVELLGVKGAPSKSNRQSSFTPNNNGSRIPRLSVLRPSTNSSLS